jgi:predicted CoA-substrate-specific enzyme activase
LEKALQLLRKFPSNKIIATGYGRYLLKNQIDCSTITEIKAFAIGACHLFPNCKAIIDVGGQDSKIIRCQAGKVSNFLMNDRCAAGTGRFLEVMANVLGFSLEEFGEVANQAQSSITLNSMCTVFAESEVITLIAKGEDPASIALGLHKSTINRLCAMINQAGYETDTIFAGGVAKNPCIKNLLEQQLGLELKIYSEPQIIGALGAALSAI